MKTLIYKSINGIQSTGTFQVIRNRAASNKLFTYSLELILLYVLVFAAMSTFAQAPAKAGQSADPVKLEFVKQTVVYNSGKVYLNWVVRSNSDDCIYVIERSQDGVEYEPVGLKEGIGSPLELLYSWVDTKPVSGTVQYRIKQINNEGKLVASADPKQVNTPETNPLLIDKNTRMVQVK
jgi:hypothetical protein